MVGLPDGVEWLADIEVFERDLPVGGDEHLDVLAGLVVELGRVGKRFEDDFFDKCGDILVAHDAEVVGRGGLLRAFAAGFVDIHENPALGDADRVGFERDADRWSLGRTITHIEAAIVFRALDEVAFHHAGGEVRVAVGANAISRVVLVITRAVDGVGVAAVVEAQHILAQERIHRSDFDPTLGIRHAGRDDGFCRLVRCRAHGGRGENALHKIAGVFDLTQNGGDDLAPRMEDAAVGSRHVGLHDLVELRQVVIRHQREHVVLHMVVHVPIQKPVDRIHVNRPAVHAVVEHIFGKTGMLGEAVDRHHPSPKKVWQADVEERQNATEVETRCDHRDVDGEVDPRFEINRGTRRLGDVGRFFRIQTACRVTEHFFEIGDGGWVAEKCRQEAFNAGRAGNGDFGVASNDNRVAVVTGVAPAPDRALAHDHERGNLVKRIVQPIALERGAVARLVPA